MLICKLNTYFSFLELHSVVRGGLGQGGGDVVTGRQLQFHHLHSRPDHQGRGRGAVCGGRVRGRGGSPAGGGPGCGFELAVLLPRLVSG
jgi:hypothetical protein